MDQYVPGAPWSPDRLLTISSVWSLATGSLPQCSRVLHLPPKPAIIDDIESSLWIPYTDDGTLRLGLPPPWQPAHL